MPPVNGLFDYKALRHIKYKWRNIIIMYGKIVTITHDDPEADWAVHAILNNIRNANTKLHISMPGCYIDGDTIVIRKFDWSWKYIRTMDLTFFTIQYYGWVPEFELPPELYDPGIKFEIGGGNMLGPGKHMIFNNRVMFSSPYDTEEYLDVADRFPDIRNIEIHNLTVRHVYLFSMIVNRYRTRDGEYSRNIICDETWVDDLFQAFNITQYSSVSKLTRPCDHIYLDMGKYFDGDLYLLSDRPIQYIAKNCEILLPNGRKVNRLNKIVVEMPMMEGFTAEWITRIRTFPHIVEYDIEGLGRINENTPESILQNLFKYDESLIEHLREAFRVNKQGGETASSSSSTAIDHEIIKRLRQFRFL